MAKDVHDGLLTPLVLVGASLVDHDAPLLHRLPSLSTLYLANTTVPGGPVFYLVVLRHTLACLSLSNSTSITDDACPALVLLTRLIALDFADITIQMPGPTSYLNTLHTRYLLAPMPPFITSLCIVSILFTAAL
ncbi:hypothetical protein K488DRAFT_86117 [Vararia minispora EC-137]|uniref:Uncharacterized protein n=1 Tax=Vararia minispora EC-137 TaxID=1314806 RepID=A0ACB8QKG1_9AGAM|nr:hypothetical protein K488DRAFT_86117 [Vararia minispora EC-137]